MDALTVGYDGGCGPCTRIWRLIGRLDLGRGHVLGVDVVDPDAVGASPLAEQDPVALLLDLHTVRDGHVSVGLDAWRAVARAVPLLWPLRLVLHLPGSTRVGTRVYRSVADRRSCAVDRRRSGEAARGQGSRS